MAQLPQSGFEVGAAPGLVGEAVPISWFVGSNCAYILCVCG